MQYWLMKSEPDVFSIDDLKRKSKEKWDGVRNYQARNYLRDQMKLKDKILFYHSNADVIGVAGLAEICREGYPDDTAFDPNHKHFDSKSLPENPRWFMVDVKYIFKFNNVVSLEILKHTKGLEKMIVTQRGSRLSVQPVTESEYNIVCQLGRSS